MSRDLEACGTVCFRLLLCGIFFALPSNAQALSLAEAYQAALTNDPTYQAAIHEHEASMESVPMARAALLPQLSFIGGYSTNSGTQTTVTPGVPAHPGAPVTTRQQIPLTDPATGQQLVGENGQPLFQVDENGQPLFRTVTVTPTIPKTQSVSTVRALDYKSYNYGVNLRWSVLNLDAIARFRQAHELEALAEAKFDVAYNDLVVRIASAYFDALLANDTRDYALAQMNAYEQQLQSAQKRWNAGEGTLTDIAETEARLATAHAELIAAEDQIAITNTTLRQFTGGEVTTLKRLRPNFATQTIEPSQLETWQDWSRELNPTLIMQRHSVEAARRDVDRTRAGHWPTLAVIGSMTETASDNVFFTSSTNQINSIGIQANIPLYSGGFTSSASSQAEATLKRALSELDARTNAVLQETQKQLRSVLSGIEQIAAFQKAVDAQQIAVKGIEAGLRLGTRINTEALEAQRLLFQSRRHLANARYQYLLSRLRLTSVTRLLTEEDLQIINSALEP